MRELISKKDGMYLIELARWAIEDKFQKSCQSLPGQSKIISFSLLEIRGVFVTLWKGNQIRGCIGSPFPELPLKDAIIDCALKATSEDTRFVSVKAVELPDIAIEVAILSSPQLMKHDQIQLGVHGVIISNGYQQGLLLPDNKEEWTIETFLQVACRKGGLPDNAWKEGAKIYSFETQVFKEEKTICSAV